MLYMLSGKGNAFRLIEFDYQSSSDHLAFFAGTSLASSAPVLRYDVGGAVALEKLRRMHFVECGGPHLVSAELRSVLSGCEERGEVEFFAAQVACDGEPVEGFTAMNVRVRVGCTDLERSEYELTGFDPARPTYDFSLHVLNPDFDWAMNVATCDEMPQTVVVGDAILESLRAAKLEGLRLCTVLDTTRQGRSTCVEL